MVFGKPYNKNPFFENVDISSCGCDRIELRVIAWTCVGFLQRGCLVLEVNWWIKFSILVDLGV